MRIEFDAGNAKELAAVSALIASLTGRVPGELVVSGDSGGVSLPVSEAPVIAPPPPPIDPAPLSPATPAAPPAPAVSTAPPAPPAAPAAGVELDADGLPWDNRIHSTPASKKKDGKWRGRRNLDDATRDAVTAELRAALAAPAVGAEPGTPAPMFEESAPGVPLPPSEPPVDAATAFAAPGAASVSSPPPPPPPAPAPAVPVATPPAPPAPPAPAAPVAEVPAAPAANAPATDFASLMKKITGLQGAGVLTVTGTTEIATSLGLAGVRDLMVRPDLIASFDALLPAAPGA